MIHIISSVFASELQENLEEKFPQYRTHSRNSTTIYCVTCLQMVKCTMNSNAGKGSRLIGHLIKNFV